MSTIWVVSDNAALTSTLAVHLRELGEVWTGPAESSRFREAPVPDLVVAVPPAQPDADLRSALEKLLEFLRRVPHPRRAPAPLLFVEAPGSLASAERMSSLIDDRRLCVLEWPFDIGELVDVARGFVAARDALPGLRERDRRAWVAQRVELFYAGLELPSLRQAIDPRNARRPVLLVGEPGTRRGMLARYIHDLCEPQRERLVVVPVAGLEPGGAEERLLRAGAGSRVTVLLSDLERAAPAVQEEIAHLFLDGGGLGVEAVRWIASATQAARLVPRLRAAPWLVVQLPALRDRPDLPLLIDDWLLAWRAASGREGTLDENALAALESYAWPGNLRELESVLERSLLGAPSSTLHADDVRFTEPPATPFAPLELQPHPEPAPLRSEAARAEPEPVDGPLIALEPVEPPPLSEVEAEPEPETRVLEPAEIERPPLERALDLQEPDLQTAAERETEPLRATELELETEVELGPELELTAEVEAEPAEEELVELEPLPEQETEEEPELPAYAGPPSDLAALKLPATGPGPAAAGAPGVSVGSLVRPLADEVRQPLRAIRTYANLLDQRPGDESLRRELQSLVDGDLSRVEALVQRLERFASFGPPALEPLDLPALVGDELRARQDSVRKQSLVVLRELDEDAPPVRADEKQMRFALGGLLDRALFMVPPGGDLYVGSLHRPARGEASARHRLLIRFHSPEDVLVAPAELQGAGLPIEITLARALIERMGGTLAVDASGTQDNVVLIELPA